MRETPEPRSPIGVHQDEQPDEAALLERVRRGDADAFDAIARDQAPRLFRMALRLTGRREDAEDLVQETLVRSLPKLSRFEGRARLSTYLLRALSNLWKNRLRSRSRSPLVSWLGARSDRDAPEPDPADPRPGQEHRLIASDRALRVRRALLALDPARRLTLLLREVEGLPYEEIAETTGVPVGTVRSRLARAREDLRRTLGEMA